MALLPVLGIRACLTGDGGDLSSRMGLFGAVVKPGSARQSAASDREGAAEDFSCNGVLETIPGKGTAPTSPDMPGARGASLRSTLERRRSSLLVCGSILAALGAPFAGELLRRKSADREGRASVDILERFVSFGVTLLCWMTSDVAP